MKKLGPEFAGSFLALGNRLVAAKTVCG